DVDEGPLHPRQHVLDLDEVDIADQGSMALPIDVVLDQYAVLEDRYLRPIADLTDHHHSVHGFAPGEKLGFSDHRRRAPAGLPALPPPLLLRLEPGRALDQGDVILAVLLAGF